MVETGKVAKKKQPAARQRQSRVWWQWVLGIGLLSTAAFFTVMRVVQYYAEMELGWQLQPAESIPLRIPPELKLTQTVPMAPGELAGCNLLLVTFDTTRSDRIGCYGNDKIETPNIDRLAREGVLFTDVIAPTPVTLPSHASILTGLYPFHHGARANTLSHMSKDCQTLAGVLSKAGYMTAAFISSFALDLQFGTGRDFAFYDYKVEKTTEFWGGMAERPGDQTTDRALAWLRDHSRTQFFAWVHYYDPHWQYNPPEEYTERCGGNSYDGEISFADAQFGRLLDELEELGLTDRTLVVATADHGEGLYQHDEATHGVLLYNTTLHVPLVMRCGQRLGGGAYLDRTASLVDIMPTALSLLGIEPADGLDGIDLTQPERDVRPIFFETLEPLAEYGWSAMLGVREGSIKYIHSPQPELFDLSKDPDEEQNLLSDQPAITARMKERLLEFYGGDLEKAGAVHDAVELTHEDLARLESLGYVGGHVDEATPGTSRQDPKAMMPLLRRVHMSIRLGTDDWLEKAIAELQAVVQEYPDFYLAHRELGGAYVKNGQYPEAEAEFWRCQELRPGMVLPLYYLADSKDQQRDFESAMEHYREVLQVYPDHYPSLRRLGELLLEREKYNEAADVLKRAHEIIPTGDRTAMLAAEALMATDRPHEAIEVLKRTLAAKPGFINVRNRLARLLKDTQRLPEAVQVLRQGLKLMPDHLDFAANLALTLVRLSGTGGQAQAEAQAIMERICEQTEYQHAGYVRALALIYSSQGRWDEAVSMAEKAERLASEAGQAELAHKIMLDLNTYRTSRAQATSQPTETRPSEVETAP